MKFRTSQAFGRREPQGQKFAIPHLDSGCVELLALSRVSKKRVGCC